VQIAQRMHLCAGPAPPARAADMDVASKQMSMYISSPPGPAGPEFTIAYRSPHRHQYTLAWWAWMLIFLLCMGLSLAGIPALSYRTYDECLASAGLLPVDNCVAYLLVWRCLFAAVCFGTSTLLVRAQANNAVLLLLACTLAATGATESLLTTALIKPELPWSMPFWSWAVYALRALAVWGALVLLYIFPDGRFTPGWTRSLAAIWTLCVVVWLFKPDLPFNMIYGETWRRTRETSLIVAAGWFGMGILAQLYRYARRTDAGQRRQIRWASAGMITAIIGTLLYYVPPHWWLGIEIATGIPGGLIRAPLFTIMVALGPLCIALAVLQHRIWDIDIVVNRTIVYGTLTTCIIALYTVVFSWLGAALRAYSPFVVSLIATGLILIAFQPLRDWLQRRVNRLLYGHRDEPYQVLTRLGRRLKETTVSGAVLPAVVETIAQTLNLPYVAIDLTTSTGAFRTEATYGQITGQPVDLLLAYQGETVGRLVVATRSPREGFTPAEHQLLTSIAHQAGAAAYAVRLNHEIQSSRERLRIALEEERRRMRRNLHDGLGPALASQAFTIDTAAHLLRRDPTAAAQLLQELKRQSQKIVADVRHLVYNLRPPALDDLGLIDAIREHLVQYEHAGISIIIDAPDPFPALPAAVEVAIYYIAIEAVTNVARHAAAHTCRVTIAVDEQVELVICDDGQGLPAQQRAGVGLASMRERAAELGGSIALRSSPGQGTLVTAYLPLDKVFGNLIADKESS
jgi:signal transduction histidine kinase